MEPFHPTFGSRAWGWSHPREGIVPPDSRRLDPVKLGELIHLSWTASLAMMLGCATMRGWSVAGGAQAALGAERGRSSGSPQAETAGLELER